jgi:hypothetical protein
MEHREPVVDEILTHPYWCYSVPPYQRPYTWTIDRWHGLIHDIAQVATSEREHWIGIFLTAKSNDPCPLYAVGGSHQCWEVIDGQQRIVTLRLFMKALEDHQRDFAGNQPPFEANLNNFRAQAADQTQINEVMSGEWKQRPDLTPAPQRGPLAAYLYFRWILWLGQDAILREEAIPFPRRMNRRPGDTRTLWEIWRDGIAAEYARHPDTPAVRSGAVQCIALAQATKQKLKILELRHEQHVDASPDRLFECLNGKRLELEQFDHVRNFVFTKTNAAIRSAIYTDVWKSAEHCIETRGPLTRGTSKLDAFLYDYLISEGESSPQKGINRAKGATHFARFWTSGRHACGADMARFLRHNFVPAMGMWLTAKTGAPIEIPSASPRPLSPINHRVILRINAMTAGPFTPLIMGVLKDFVSNHRTEAWLDAHLHGLEAYAARLLLAGKGLSPLRSTTMQIAAKCFVPGGVPLLDHLVTVMPSESEVRNQVEQCYNRSSTEKDFGDSLRPPQICAIFDAIEQHLSHSVDTHIAPYHKTKNPNGFSIEHICPRNIDKWRRDQAEWGMRERDIRDQAKMIHQLGNVTVLPLPANKKLQNNPLAKKITQLHEKGITALNVNSDWMAATRWTPSEITQRTHRLLDAALGRWTIHGV